jgi:hypothetical protein
MKKNLFFALIAMGGMACNHNIVPDAPDESAYPAPPPPTASNINIPVKINLAELAKTLNAKVPNELYSDLKGTDIGYGSSIALRIVRNGTIYLTTKDSRVTTNIPIKITDGKLTTTALGLKHSEPFGATMYVQMNTTVGADANWNFASVTSPDFVWGEEPTLRVAGINIPLGRVTTAPVKAQLAKIAPMIDQQIKDLVHLRSTMEGVWNGFKEPRLMTDSPAPVWLTIFPTDFAVSPPQSVDKSNLSFTIGIKTFVQTSVGTKPPAQELGALPNLQIKTFNDDHFNLTVPAVVRYDDIKMFVQQRILGQKYPVKNNITIEIKDFDFFGRGDKIAMMLDFVSEGGANTKGKFYLVGKPVIDTLTQTLRLDDLDFDLKSKNKLLSSANFLLHKPLLNKIKQQAIYPLAPQLEAAKQYAQQSLNDYPISENVFLKGVVQTVRLDQIYLGKDYLRAYINAAGTLEGGFRHK